METCTARAAMREVREATRRDLLVGAIHALWAAMATAVGAPACWYLLQAPKARVNNEWIDIGDITELPTGRPVEMLFQHNHTDGWKTGGERLSAWVVKTRNSGVVAFGPQCTHLGCAHHWDEGEREFVCPCHSSRFSIEGVVLGGPAPRALDRYEAKIEGNRLLLGELRKPPLEVL